jgi:hypothetical protein
VAAHGFAVSQSAIYGMADAEGVDEILLVCRKEGALQQKP